MLELDTKTILICGGILNLVWWPLCRACGCPSNQAQSYRRTEDDPQPISGPEADEATTRKSKKRCCPYSFDSKTCRTVGGRILCGYNTNLGEVIDSNEARQYSGGPDCHIRKGRLECGYFEGPFSNPRRPPAAQPGPGEYEVVTIRVLKGFVSNPFSQEPVQRRNNDPVAKGRDGDRGRVPVAKDRDARITETRRHAYAAEAAFYGEGLKVVDTTNLVGPPKQHGAAKAPAIPIPLKPRLTKPQDVNQEEIKCVEIKDRIVCKD